MRVLLVGHPVTHSLSPVMQNAAFAALDLPHLYQARDTPAEALAGVLSGLRDGQHLGANVTVPHKLAALPSVDAVDDGVQTLGALNTIVARDGQLSGHNTDIDGVWEGLLRPVAGSLQGARVTLLGAGGAARAVLLALCRCGQRGPAEVTILARRGEAAAATSALGAELGLPCRPAAWAEIGAVAQTAGVVINCTPLGLGDEDPLEGVALSGLVVLDLAYRRGGTALFRRARAQAEATLQGDGMLLHQGAAAFRLWTGRDAPLAVMRRALQEALA